MNLENVKTGITLFSAVIIPVALAYLGNSYTQAQKERDIQAQFVKMAVDILQSRPDGSNANEREWAKQIINKYSGVPLSGDVRRELTEDLSRSAAALGMKFARRVQEDELSRIQGGLRALGLYKGDTTGMANRETIAAIVAFQRARGLAADGAISPAIRLYIEAEVAKLDKN